MGSPNPQGSPISDFPGPKRLLSPSIKPEASNQGSVAQCDYLNTSGQAQPEDIKDEMESECTICLEDILETDHIGVIPSCCGKNKLYHDRCIIQWSFTSNSCPTCRRRFHKVEIYVKNRLDYQLQSITVKDKLLPNDAINDIPAEYVIPASTRQHEEEEDSRLTSGVCSICSSSEYNSRTKSSVNCNYCGSFFHLECMGITPDMDISSWCCPICDNDQEFAQPVYPNRRTRPVSRTIVRPPARQRTTTTSTRSTRPGLVIHNENNELDVDFLYDDNESISEDSFPDFINDNQPQVINGGVLLRKELRAQQNLSKEELQSWKEYDVARNIESSIEPSPSQPEAASITKRRRRKRITPLNDIGASDVSISSDKPSRISSLISQLKRTPPQPQFNLCTKKPGQLPITGPSYVASSSGSLADSPASMSPSGNSPLNDSDTQYDSGDPKVQKVPMELTLDQKVEIQKYIRLNLRKLYRPNKVGAEPNMITSEEDYIKINKIISRKIYGHILAEAEESSDIEDYFKDEVAARLKNLVDRYVTEELGLGRAGI